MKQVRYNPAIHHRRSIRLEGHDYAGGGTYFVTICAHRDFVAATGGRPFGDASVIEMIGRIWEGIHKGHPYVGAPLVGARIVPARKEGTHKGCPYHIVMPDHFHGIVEIPAVQGAPSLGELIGAFKSKVVHAYIQGVKAGKWPRFPGKVWQRNYYERIVRNAQELENVKGYIRMNPWRCVTDFGNGLRGMGNPALWNREKLAVCCSRDAPPIDAIPEAEAYMGGFHSPPEKQILTRLLSRKANVILCPAWGLDGSFPADVIAALEENRMLILEMTNRNGDLAAAEDRNRFVLQNADRHWLPYVSPHGMLRRLVDELELSDTIGAGVSGSGKPGQNAHLRIVPA